MSLFLRTRSSNGFAVWAVLAAAGCWWACQGELSESNPDEAFEDDDGADGDADTDGDGDADADGDADGDGDADADGDSDADTDGDSDSATGSDDEVPDPGEPGAHTWSAFTVDLAIVAEQSGDQYDIRTDIYLPDTEGPLPVVVFTHGFQLGPSNYATLGAHLASWGYIAVLPQMPGSLFSAPTHLELKQILAPIVDWVAEQAGDASGPLEGKPDPKRLALSGHSMGGKISLLLSATDTRPICAFLIDPVDSGSPNTEDPVNYPSVTPELMPDIDIPLGFLGETTNATGGMGGQACAPEDQNFHQYFIHTVGPAIEIEALGANHMSFLDDPDCGLPCTVCPKGTDNPETSRYLSRKYMTAFYNVYLSGQAQYLLYLTGEEMDADVAAGLVTVETLNDFGQ